MFIAEFLDKDLIKTSLSEIKKNEIIKEGSGLAEAYSIC